MLLKQSAVHHKAVGVRAHRQPVDAAILIHEAVEVGIINGARLVAGGKIHQAVLQRLCVMERKPAAGDHIRQLAVFVEEFIEIQIVVSHHKFHVHIRKLGLDVGGVLFIQVRRPQIHLDGFFLILRSPPGAACQEGNAHRQRQQQRSHTSPYSLFHRLSSLQKNPFHPACFCPQKNTFRTWNTTSESVLFSEYQVLDTASTQRSLCAALIDPAAK